MNLRLFIFVLIVQSILWLGHAFLWATAVTFFPVDLGSMALLLGALSLTFVSSNLLAWRYHLILTRIYYIFSAVWLGIGHILLMVSIIAWVLLGVTYLVPFAAGTADQIAVSDPALLIGTVVFTTASVVAIYALTFGRRVRVRNYTVRLDNLPQPWRGRTAVWISDLHLGHINGVRFARRIVSQVNNLRPDIVFIGGDLFDGADGNLPQLAAPIAGLSAPLGVYFITGNHEEFTDRERFLRPIRGLSNVGVLLNESVEIDGLRLIGVDYRDTASKERFETVLHQMLEGNSAPSVLLKHDPSHAEIAERLGVDLQLSGHTHAGQLFPFRYITHRVYRGHDYGFSRHGRLQIVTSSGAGTWGPPMRLGTRSEIVRITFD